MQLISKFFLTEKMKRSNKLDTLLQTKMNLIKIIYYKIKKKEEEI